MNEPLDFEALVQFAGQLPGLSHHQKEVRIMLIKR
jgi:hypothetical protein